MTEPKRFEPLELPTGWTVVELVAETVAAPRRLWDRSDAALVVEALAASPGYAVQLRWERAS